MIVTLLYGLIDDSDCDRDQLWDPWDLIINEFSQSENWHFARISLTKFQEKQLTLW